MSFGCCFLLLVRPRFISSSHYTQPSLINKSGLINRHKFCGCGTGNYELERVDVLRLIYFCLLVNATVMVDLKLNTERLKLILTNPRLRLAAPIGPTFYGEKNGKHALNDSVFKFKI